jgi:hypothetical protein
MRLTVRSAGLRRGLRYPPERAGPGFLMRAACVLAACVLAACVPPSGNLTDPLGPRHAGPLPGPPPADGGDHVRVVSFNLKEGEAVREAAAMLRDDDDLRDADVVLLQEMDAVGADWIADALGMAWVYYPATLRAGRGFGNAVLSRWPIVDDQKVILPHVGRLRGTQRSATAPALGRYAPDALVVLESDRPAENRRSLDALRGLGAASD